MNNRIWQNQVKMKTALDLYRMYPNATIPMIAHAIGRNFKNVYRYFKNNEIGLRDVRLGWNKVRRGLYVSPCQRFTAGRLYAGRWDLYRDGEAIEVCRSFKEAVQKCQ